MSEGAAGYGSGTLAALGRDVVGRRREIELVVAALMAERHLLLEGPPGTGKSTLLRSLAAASGHGFAFVEGNAELTPARLAGHFDPAQVLEAGYDPNVWVDGPLCRSMRDGALLYIEEINRIPEETLNLLVTVMSERELTVPRLGRIVAHPDFRIVAAMNPYDAVGTARISGAIYDRVCRVSMDYQSGRDERAIVDRHHQAADRVFAARMVDLVRSTRTHPEIRVGSSVRGAVDLLLLAHRLGELRDLPADDRRVALDAALTALSGRIQLHDSANLDPEQVITELFDRAMAQTVDEAELDRDDAADGAADDGAGENGAGEDGADEDGADQGKATGRTTALPATTATMTGS